MAGERRINVMHDRVNTWIRFDLGFYDRSSKMIRKFFVPLLATLFLAGVFGTLSGCNTVAGAGQDIEQGGKAITNEAQEHKRY
jgi:entericidin B